MNDQLQRVDAQDWEKAAEECKKWTKAGGQSLRGIENRRAEGATMLLNG
ncbi:glycoside hydrolase family protein [Candidatus Liberibacter asiaticus]|nr:glycoside hydrolase family protein [Candidatus Liberibacter asiaticus]